MDAIYDEILDLVKAKENFAFEAYKMPMLIRRINNRILKTHSKSPEEYLLLLKKSGGESKELINNFLINVSHFFRDPLLFEYLRAKIIPELFATAISQEQTSIRIWSSGCAAGEEPYSLAILLNEQCQKENRQMEITFFATDYDTETLKKAEEATYSFNQLDEIKLKYIEKYFSEENGIYKLDSAIQSMVQFSTYNMLDKNSYAPSESIFGGFDLVLCRNMLIYFQEDAQHLVFEKLYKSLLPNKVLVLGDAEIPPENFKNKFHQINDCCKMYRKVDYDD